MVALYDAHNHLQDAWLAPHLTRVCTDLALLPLRAAVVNGTAENDWAEVASLAQAHAFVLPSYGLHPWHVGNAATGWRERLIRFLDTDPRAVIGEIGLDRWILERARPDDPRLAGLRRAPLDEQLAAFSTQLALAHVRELPVTIHCVDAWGALDDMLRREPLPSRGFLLHAYGGSIELARTLAERGAFFSFNGSFLGERQRAKREVFQSLPLERLLVETDAPAMPPPPEFCTHPLPSAPDGKPLNHPANLESIYRGLAALRGLSLETLATQIEKNFHALFGAR